ncbi:MAG TPA: hypothetical protein VGM27_07955 [Acidobacteriaceae bacterium]
MSSVSVRNAIGPAADDPRWALVQRVIASEAFRTTARLRNFLLYIADCALRDAPEAATEQHIGIHVFGRQPGYNSSEDSIVRTHARLLRLKLDGYFAKEGAGEELIVEIPKGHYLPVFRAKDISSGVRPVKRSDEVQVENQLSQPQTIPQRGRPAKALGWNPPVLVMAALLLALTALAFLQAHHRRASPVTAMDRLWQPFLSSDPPLVIYSNGLFEGDAKNGLRYATPPQPGRPAAEHYVDTYTGVGEVVAVHHLTRLFDAHHADFILKRSLLVPWDEAKIKNLIFIGSQAENPSLKVLPTTTEFSMISDKDSAGIVNHNPKPGEPTIYSRPEYPLTKDYATVALLPGVGPNTRMLILSGLTTLGTEAAVEFVCNPQSAGELLQASSLPNGEVRSFEAVLETAIHDGVPLGTKLVSIHLHP